MTEHKPTSQNQSVEQNLAKNYISKSKIGNLPISNQINDAMKKKMDKTQKDIDKFKTQFLKQNKLVQAIGIIPTQASKKIEEEYEISEDDSKKELIHILTIIPEAQYKNIGKIKLETIQLAKSINENIWASPAS